MPVVGQLWPSDNDDGDDDDDDDGDDDDGDDGDDDDDDDETLSSMVGRAGIHQGSSRLAAPLACDLHFTRDHLWIRRLWARTWDSYSCGERKRGISHHLRENIQCETQYDRKSFTPFVG